MRPKFFPSVIILLSVALAGCANSSQPAVTTTNASLSASSFNFGNNLVNNSITDPVVTVTNAGTIALNLSPGLSGDSSYSISNASTCTTTLAAGSSCTVSLTYDPTTASTPAAQNATLNLNFSNAAAGTADTVAITGVSAALAAGIVTPTDNPQVALYTMTLPFPGTMTVNFGTTTGYGLSTWTQSTAVAGGQVSIFVAGMLQSTLYHMQAALQFTNGLSANDSDHTFTTQALPASLLLNVTTTTTPGMTPQPGLELLNPLEGTPNGVEITDLSGDVLWAYANPGNPALNFIDGVKILPNGDFLMNIGANSTVPPHRPCPGGNHQRNS